MRRKAQGAEYAKMRKKQHNGKNFIRIQNFYSACCKSSYFLKRQQTYDKIFQFILNFGQKKTQSHVDGKKKALQINFISILAKFTSIVIKVLHVLVCDYLPIEHVTYLRLRRSFSQLLTIFFLYLFNGPTAQNQHTCKVIFLRCRPLCVR